jgi:uncharacterized membrane protein
MKETHKRTIARMISYRIGAVMLTIPLTYWATGNWEIALSGSAILHVLLTVGYYLHERIWLNIKWGLK